MTLAAGLWLAGLRPWARRFRPSRLASMIRRRYGWPAGYRTRTYLEIKPLDVPEPRKRRAADPILTRTRYPFGRMVLYPSLTIGAVASTNVANRHPTQRGHRSEVKPSLRFRERIGCATHGPARRPTISVAYPGQRIQADKADATTTLRLEILHDTPSRYDGELQPRRSGPCRQSGPPPPSAPAPTRLSAQFRPRPRFGAFETSLRRGHRYLFSDVALSVWYRE